MTTGHSRHPAGATPTVLMAHPGAQLYGSDRMLIESVCGLIGGGWRVVVTVPESGPLVEEIRSRGATVVVSPTPVLRRSFLTPAGVLRLAAQGLASIPPSVRLLRRHRPDTVYVNTVTIPLWLVLARLWRVPSVCHVHEAESNLPAAVRRALTAPLVLAERLVLNSRFAAQVLVNDWPFVRTRVDLVYNGVAGPDAPAAPRTTLTAPVRLLYVGRLSERKGVRDAVDALAVLHRRGVEATLDLVGDAFTGYERFKEDLVERARASGTAEALRFHGFDPDIWPHVARADIVVAPFLLDSFGLVVVEGALGARPVVLARAGGMVEAASASRASLVVQPGNPVEIADAVAAIVERWADFRDRAVEDVVVVAERFSMARYRSAVSEVLTGAADEGRRRRQRGHAP